MNTNENKFDNSALRARILEQYGSIESFAKAVKMKADVLHSRLDNETEFDQGELVKIRDALKLSNDEARRLFFVPEDLAKLNCLLNEMTDDEIKLLDRIMELISGRPDRREYALNYIGKMKDLPAALAQI